MNLEQLIEAAREEGPRADPMARARLRVAIARKVQAGVDPMVSRSMVRRRAWGKTRMVVLLAAAVLFVVGTGFAMLEVRHRRAFAPVVAAPVAAVEARATPAPVLAVSLAPPAVSTETTTPAPAPTAHRGRKPAAPPPELEAEMGALREAREALQRADHAGALDALDRYDARFKRGTLGQEAAALRVFALCDAGRDAAARSLGAVFVRRWPQSPMRARIEETCAGPASSTR